MITHGEQPIGLSVGPALEAREALEVLMKKRNVSDLIDKACHIAGVIFEIAGKKNGYNLANDILRAGKAEKKLREIISLQGGNSKIKPEDLVVGNQVLQFKTKKSGQILWMDNNILVEIARAAGAPKDKGSGIVFNKKCGDSVDRNEVLFTIHAEKSRKLSRAQDILDEQEPVGVGKTTEMFIHEVKEPLVVKRAFVLDR